MLSLIQRAAYLRWATLRNLGNVDRTCPGCEASATRLVRRKYFVTALYACEICGLRFRVPKDDAVATKEFYQDDYQSGFTTECPSDKELDQLIASEFRGSEKDFLGYVAVLREVGLPAGASVLDFGASWGYGSWQLQRAGYSVVSYELSRARARYAREKLNCRTVESVEELRYPVDCVFSAHVIEHLPDPNLLWRAAQRVLKPAGMLVAFCPNGNAKREHSRGTVAYDRAWGKVHPLLITPEYVRRSAAAAGFEVSLHSSPYRAGVFEGLAAEGALDGDELLFIARRAKRTVSLAVPQ